MLTCVSAAILLCSFQSGITDLVLQPDHAPLLKANPLLMEIPGAKVIKTETGFVLIGVGSAVIKGNSSKERIAAEKIATIKARAALVGERDGILVFQKTTANEKTTITQIGNKETGKSVSTILQINEETISGAIKGSEVIGRWRSDDREVVFVAVLVQIDKSGNRTK
jgi:hypothetical protein